MQIDIFLAKTPLCLNHRHMKIDRMRIPVFVSCPSHLSKEQEASAKIIHDLIRKYQLEWRALGRSDYPGKLPLREVLRMIKHCSGGIILGFEQFRADSGIAWRGTSKETPVRNPVVFPTPWNQLEAGILFNQKLPMMIFKEEGISGGIFDLGITDVFIHKMPNKSTSKDALGDLDSVFQQWVAEVKNKYYED